MHLDRRPKGVGCSEHYGHERKIKKVSGLDETVPGSDKFEGPGYDPCFSLRVPDMKLSCYQSG